MDLITIYYAYYITCNKIPSVYGLIKCFLLSRLFFFLLFRATPVRHMELPRAGVEMELQLLAYTTATATPDPSYFYDPQHSSQQHQILNPLSKARDQTCNLLVPSRIHFHCATTGTPRPYSRCSRRWTMMFPISSSLYWGRGLKINIDITIIQNIWNLKF